MIVILVDLGSTPSSSINLKVFMKNEEIKKFFNDIRKLKLSKKEKERMLRLFQVRGINKKNKVMSFCSFKRYISENEGKITRLVLGPDWSRLVFVDIDIEV